MNYNLVKFLEEHDDNSIIDFIKNKKTEFFGNYDNLISVLQYISLYDKVEIAKIVIEDKNFNLTLYNKINFKNKKNESLSFLYSLISNRSYKTFMLFLDFNKFEI